MPFTQTNLAELKVLMKNLWDHSVFWSDDEARLAINETLREWNLLTGRWSRTLNLTLSAAPSKITLPSTFTYGLRVRRLIGGNQPILPASRLELDLAQPNWRQESVNSGGNVPTIPTFFAPLSLTVLEVWPSVIAQTTVQVTGISDTPVLNEDGDTIDIGEETVDILLDFALHIATFKEGGPRWEATLPKWQAFLQAAAEENQLLKTSKLFRRYAGLDRWRDLKPVRQGQTRLDGIASGLPPLGGS